MFELFSEGGPWGMSLLTVELICLLFAAWKAPAWIKEIGLLAPVTAFVYMLIGYSEAMRAVQQAGDISPALREAYPSLEDHIIEDDFLKMKYIYQ